MSTAKGRIMIRTVIINSQKQDREKIISILSPSGDIKVLASGKDGYDALKLIGNLKPDIAILDNHLEYIEGEEIPPLLRIRSPLTSVLILVARISDYQLYRAASNDVSGFVNKETDLDTLPWILRCVFEGGCFISPALGSRVLNLLSVLNREKNHACAFAANRIRIKAQEKEEGEFASIKKEDPSEYLSKTELRILSHVGEGLTSDEIAQSLGLAIGTVRNYISSVMHKAGLRNRSQMARYAFSCGLVPLNSIYCSQVKNV